MIKIKTKFSDSEGFIFYPSCWPLIDNSEYKPRIFEWNDEVEFCYIPEMRGFLVPKSKNLDIDKVLEEKTIYSFDWDLRKISPNPDPSYILNYYTRGETTYSIIKKEFEDMVRGVWELENKDLGVCIGFSVLPKKEYSEEERRVFVCYPEKTEIPYDPVRIINKSNFILYFLWKRLSLGESLGK